jgi:hypothetical protein
MTRPHAAVHSGRIQSRTVCEARIDHTSVCRNALGHT